MTGKVVRLNKESCPFQISNNDLTSARIRNIHEQQIVFLTVKDWWIATLTWSQWLYNSWALYIVSTTLLVNICNMLSKCPSSCWSAQNTAMKPLQPMVRSWPEVNDSCSLYIIPMWWTLVPSYLKIPPRHGGYCSKQEIQLYDIWAHGATLNLNKDKWPLGSAPHLNMVKTCAKLFQKSLQWLKCYRADKNSWCTKRQTSTPKLCLPPVWETGAGETPCWSCWSVFYTVSNLHYV